MENNPMKFLRLLAGAPRGCWIALNDAEDAVAGHGRTVLEALKQARAAGVKNPLVLWSPENAVAAKGNGLDAADEAVVLVVDDDAEVCELACALLEMEGYTALPASGAQEALDLARSNEIDVLLTDVMLPDVNGLELAEGIGAVRPTVKILFMSGHTADPLVQNLIGKYEMCFVKKPFSKATLLAKVRWVLEQEEACGVPEPTPPSNVEASPAV